MTQHLLQGQLTRQMIKIKLFFLSLLQIFHKDAPFYTMLVNSDSIRQFSTLQKPSAVSSAEVWQERQQLDPGPFRQA